jgi:hypothetical protein
MDALVIFGNVLIDFTIYESWLQHLSQQPRDLRLVILNARVVALYHTSGVILRFFPPVVRSRESRDLTTGRAHVQGIQNINNFIEF